MKKTERERERDDTEEKGGKRRGGEGKARLVERVDRHGISPWRICGARPEPRDASITQHHT